MMRTFWTVVLILFNYDWIDPMGFRTFHVSAKISQPQYDRSNKSMIPMFQFVNSVRSFQKPFHQPGHKKSAVLTPNYSKFSNIRLQNNDNAMQKIPIDDNHTEGMESNNELSFDGEIVGASGRLGSLLERNGMNRLYSVPRNESPGLHSKIGTPIYVTTPAGAISSIIEMTPSGRWTDLVLICNGIFSEIIKRDIKLSEQQQQSLRNVEHMTVAVPHFGVLSHGAYPIGGTKSAPPTLIYGKHAKALQTLLDPLYTVQVQNVVEVEQMAAQKLLWASVMWLLTSENDLDGSAMTVELVHTKRLSELKELVKELLPAVKILAGVEGNADDSIGTVDEVLEYLKSYSMSMPGAKPNKALALAEINERNGQLLSVTSVKQPLHESWIERVSGTSVNEALNRNKSIQS